MVEQNPGIMAIKQTRPNKSRFRHCGKFRGSDFTGIFNFSKEPQYVIFIKRKKKKKIR